MKKVATIFCLIVFCLNLQAQPSLGIGSPGPDFSETPEQRAKFDHAEKIRLSQANPFRTVTNQVFNVQQSALWKIITGVVSSQSAGGLIYIEHGQKLMAIRNCTADATAGKTITLLAIRTGTYASDGYPVELWDCGTPYVPPPIPPEQLAAQVKSHEMAEARRKAEGSANTLKWLQEQSANGDTAAQYRLGERYLTGNGVETNRALAIQWLQKAVVGGSLEASNKLATIK